MMSLIEGTSASPNAALVSPKDIVTSGLCIGCGSCVAQAARAGAQMRLDRYGQFKPVGPSAWLARRSPQFSRTCPFSPAAKNEDELAAADFPVTRHQDGLIGRWQAAYVGHVEEDGFRANGSSGGMVSCLGAFEARNGGWRRPCGGDA
jgi:coenzyme F420-reducing hydrogenase beta subunit